MADNQEHHNQQNDHDRDTNQEVRIAPAKLDIAARSSGIDQLPHAFLALLETFQPFLAPFAGIDGRALAVRAGAHVFHLAVDDHQAGLDLEAVLHTLSAQGITRLLVEGGAKVASSFLKAGLVDEFWLFQGMKSIGSDGVAALDGQQLETAIASGWLADETERFGDDRLTVYRRAGSV